MATSNQIVDVAPALSSAASTPGRFRVPIASMLIFMLLGAVIASLGFGGLLYYLARSGRLSMRGGVVKAVPKAVIKTHLVILDPLLVNLADEGGTSYLRLSLTLQVEDPVEKKDSKTKDEKNGDDAVAAIRDTALSVLGRQTAQDLLEPDGKELLKTELKQALVEHNGDLKVAALFFTDFLVQK